MRFELLEYTAYNYIIKTHCDKCIIDRKKRETRKGKNTWVSLFFFWGSGEKNSLAYNLKGMNKADECEKK